MAIICRCGHADKYHSTGIPNKCTRCDACEYFTPNGSSKPRRAKPMIAVFDGTCNVCRGAITSQKDKIIRIRNVWIHNSCSSNAKQE